VLQELEARQTLQKMPEEITAFGYWLLAFGY
jgi:hypothetical protein